MTSGSIMRSLAAFGAILALGWASARARAAEPSSPQTIQMESVALPVIVNGALLNYVFVSIRLELVPNADGAAVRAKEQFFRDDLVRTGHRTSFTRLDDYTRLDEAKIRAEILRIAPSIIGPGQLKSVVITKQVSQKLLTMPGAVRKRAPEIVP
jgi:flagellar basal body-associated protein FliL